MFQILMLLSVLPTLSPRAAHVSRTSYWKDVQNEIDREWLDFIQTFNKTYKDREAAERRKIFADNFRRIEQHNAEAAQGKHTYTLGVNQFTDMTSEEFRNVMLMKTGREANGVEKEDANPIIDSKNNIRTPNNSKQKCTTFDWRDNGNAVSPVKDQGKCASCWAFAATSALESQMMIAYPNSERTLLSEQNLLDCSSDYGTRACDGGYMHQAYEYIKENGGIDTQNCYEYQGKRNHYCCFQRRCVGARIVNFKYIPDTANRGLDDLKEVLETHGPVAVLMDIGNPEKFKGYKQGNYKVETCNPYNRNHAMLVVGYEYCGKVTALIMKNSYGTGWGDDGYLRMSAQNAEKCGILNYEVYPEIQLSDS